MKISKAQIAVLDMLDKGFPVRAYQNSGSGYWSASCNYLPSIRITTLDVLTRKGFLYYKEAENNFVKVRFYLLTEIGRKELRSYFNEWLA